MYKLYGKINFFPENVTRKQEDQSSWKRVAIVEFPDDEIYLYYSWLVQQRFGIYLNKPVRGTHFTLINDRVDTILYEELVDKFNQKEIMIEYDPGVITANRRGHWWVKAYSDDAQYIRDSIGLGYPFHGYHITIGVATGFNLEKTLYLKDNYDVL
jgi:hypothetical protein